MLSSAITPDTKKKKIALPSVLSNIRNAVGRAGGTDESGRNEVEIRPLMGNKSSEDLVGIVSTKKSYVTDNSRSLRDRSTVPSSSSSGIPPPPLSGASPLYGVGQNSSSSSSSRQTLPPRNAASTSSINSWSATLQTYSERIGSQWRKQRKNRRDSNEKSRRRGVTINTQPIIIVLGLFFIGFPILLMLFLLARKAVFGDEGIDNVAKHEVPAHDEVVPSNNIDVNDWKELTSEDNPLGLVLNNEKNEVGTGIVSNEADTNEVVDDVNGESIKKEAVVVEDEVSIINEQNTNVISNVAVEDETVDNASKSLRGSREETMNVPVADQQDLPVVLNNEGNNGNTVEKNEEQEVAITAFSPASDEKTTLESNKKKEIVVEDLVVHEQEVKAENTVDVVAAAKGENIGDVGNVSVENANAGD